MNPKQRIKMISLNDKIMHNESYAKKIGVKILWNMQTTKKVTKCIQDKQNAE